MQESTDFPANLRHMTSYYRSIAEVCRRIPINRQQFDKYLAGTTQPSLHNLKRMADFFGVEESEFLLSHEDFLRMVMGRPIGLDLPRPVREFLTGSRLAFVESEQAMERYCGLYHSYFLSPAWPNGILCGLYSITNADGMTLVKSIERLGWVHRARSEFFTHKYLGFAQMMENRLYIMDYQPLLQTMYSMTILYPSSRNKITELNGLVTSVSAGVSRKPYSSRIILSKLADGTDFRTALQACAVYPDDSPVIDPTIRSRVHNTIHDPSGTLTAIDY